MRTMVLGTTSIGGGQPVYVIAEIGINHNGDPDAALRLMQAAAEAGANAVKFQKRNLSDLYRRDVLECTWRFEQHIQYIIPVLRQTELEEETFVGLKQEADHLGLDFLCTPFDAASVRFLESLDLPAHKIASADLTNIPLLDAVARVRKPMIVSTGMATGREVEEAVAVLDAHDIPFALLHCRSVYPVHPREAQLKRMVSLRRFGRPVGYSSHDVGITIPLIAVALGACIIEKHLTLNRNMPGPDHRASLEPHEFRRLVEEIRVAEDAMGEETDHLSQGEILNRELFGKSLVAARFIPRGTPIRKSMVCAKGPARGVPPHRLHQIVGLRATRDYEPDDYFTESDDADHGPRSTENGFESLWGLIARFSDAGEFIRLNPKTLEIRLTENDLETAEISERVFPQHLVVHAPEYMGDQLVDLCAEDEATRGRSVEQVRKAIVLARKWSPRFKGSPKLVVHPGAMSLKEDSVPQRLRENLLRSWEELRSDGVELLMENLPPFPWYFGGQWRGHYFMGPEDIVDFCRRTDSGFCFDLSHASLYCNAGGVDLCEFIEAVREHIRHIHFADARGLDGEGIQIGDGDIDFNAVMPLFSDYRDTWVPEIWLGHLHGGRGFIEALTRLSGYDL
ncbi:MAG: N-acetylneuraminate synthase family protein [Deltaproteobacteria bacterium]|nr:N-acetylneuraminate synthase family protein [Deltaproteobacteria bacterium]